MVVKLMELQRKWTDICLTGVSKHLAWLADGASPDSNLRVFSTTTATSWQLKPTFGEMEACSGDASDVMQQKIGAVAL